MTTIARAGRMLIAAVAMLLAAFLILDSSANSAAAASSSRPGDIAASSYADASRAAAPATAQVLPAGEHDLEGRRPSRAPLTVPAAHGKHGSLCDCDAGRPGSSARYAATAATAARYPGTVVCTSGELSIALQVFRC
ncbi:hypothetical protein ACZ90_27585 [Streptomyces albus subsp. albus]|nr:hypothetical protein ACZ90_27585 [Streptomyces albus subsp. albus]